MRAWERVQYREKCGHCGELIEEGSPIQTIQWHGMRKRKLIRCEKCAEGDAPPDLPANPERETIEQIAARFPLLNAKDILPKRTRGALKTLVPEWLPYADKD